MVWKYRSASLLLCVGYLKAHENWPSILFSTRRSGEGEELADRESLLLVFVVLCSRSVKVWIIEVAGEVYQHLFVSIVGDVTTYFKDIAQTSLQDRYPASSSPNRLLLRPLAMRGMNDRSSPFPFTPFSTFKPIAVSTAASAKSGVAERTLCVMYEPKENPMRATFSGTPMLPVYLPARTSPISP
jgi:hypothetical protein